jgi:hypothetical protein
LPGLRLASATIGVMAGNQDLEISFRAGAERQ